MAAGRAAVEAVWKLEAPQLLAALTRKLGSLEAAEDAAQEALLAALEVWPRDGLPDRPGAWLMRVAERRGVDAIRHWTMAFQHHQQLGQEADAAAPRNAPEQHALHQEAQGGLGDDTLRLLFMACHPVLAPEAQLALTLKLLAGLTTAEIARALLHNEPAVAQRLVRAKRQLAEAQVPCELPQGDARRARLPAVLHTIYLLFNEGYTATTGTDWHRPALCDEALRLARSLAAHLPEEPEEIGRAHV
jgi:RNA polymerase sigma factor (sigma-70 family)